MCVRLLHFLHRGRGRGHKQIVCVPLQIFKAQIQNSKKYEQDLGLKCSASKVLSQPQLNLSSTQKLGLIWKWLYTTTIFNRFWLLCWHLSRQHLSWRQLSISGISQLLLTRCWPNIKGRFLEPFFNRCQPLWGYLSSQHLSISGISQLLLSQFWPKFKGRSQFFLN